NSRRKPGCIVRRPEPDGERGALRRGDLRRRALAAAAAAAAAAARGERGERGECGDARPSARRPGTVERGDGGAPARADAPLECIVGDDERFGRVESGTSSDSGAGDVAASDESIDSDDASELTSSSTSSLPTALMQPALPPP